MFHQVGLGWKFGSIQFSSQNKSEFSKCSTVPKFFVQHQVAPNIRVNDTSNIHNILDKKSTL
jgi:hypothetical protein